MKKLLLIAFMAIGITAASKAQYYNTGIGLRAGFTNGLTIKHFLGTKASIEGIIGSRWHGVEFTGLYEINNRAFDADRLNWFFGFGGHIGFWDGDRTYWGEPNTNYTVVGLDGILGLEYSFIEVPLSLSIDWKPSFNIVNNNDFWADGGALSIRYIF
ncbi:MAG: hypothetical protein WCX31_02185 [Salinivirgaceae bacterium]